MRSGPASWSPAPWSTWCRRWPRSGSAGRAGTRRTRPGCRWCGSGRTSHKLFELEDITVSRWIQQRRLERCRDDLARRQVAHLTIAAVAHRRGFTSASHFSRVFRAAYGVSPAEGRGSARRRAA
ncbi:helix-turn-helix domain-containing protein [Streptomyces capoamus]|uniref:helix-turn-helix domain-containing protein n=1 Tax=Streptomyces capoamus TaxID=68183 RepID=UPI00339ABA97